MRFATVVLLALLGLVHVELWFGHDGGVPRLRELQLRLAQQRADNDTARARNEQLQAEVRDLREGLEMVEERARYELGMVKPDEILVQVASGPAAAAVAPAAGPPSPPFIEGPVAPVRRPPPRAGTPARPAGPARPH